MEGYAHGVQLVLVRLSMAAVLSVFFLFGLPLLAAAAPAVVIHEMMWDGDEYLELYNTTGEELALDGWTLTRQQAGGDEKAIVQFDEEDTISGGGYFLLEKREAATTVAADRVASSLTLLNTAGEAVRLRDAAGAVVDTANEAGLAIGWFAGENTADGVAMERTDPVADGGVSGSWHTSTGEEGGRFGTPRAANSEPAVNAPPEAVISGPTGGKLGALLAFSAEDSADPDDDVLMYAWSFGDGATATGPTAEHAYTKAGTYTVALTVEDEAGLAGEAMQQVTVSAPVYSSAVIINEVLPNPTGSDTAAEFIELHNTGSAAVELAGWQLDDAEGGSSPHTIGAGVTLGAGGYRVFLRSETGLALNNTDDDVRLFDPAGGPRGTVSFSDGAEGYAYARGNSGTYSWSTTVTAGAANILTAPAADDDAEDPEDTEADDDAAAGSVAGSQAVAVPLAAVREEEPGTFVTVTGVVSTPPGVVGKYVMYVAGSGIQVYLSREAWPALKLGDTVEITGELSSSRGEARLKLASAADVSVARAGEPPEPHLVETGEVEEALEGWLVTVQGNVTETSGDTFYVDDGSGAVKVYITASSGIDKPAMKKDTAVTITGVVSETTSGYRILPRFQEDVRLGRVAGLTSFPATGTGAVVLMSAISAAMLLVVWGQYVQEPLVCSSGRRKRQIMPV